MHTVGVEMHSISISVSPSSDLQSRHHARSATPKHPYAERAQLGQMPPAHPTTERACNTHTRVYVCAWCYLYDLHTAALR